jgi:exosortase J
MAFHTIVFSQKLFFTWGSGLLRVFFLPIGLPICLYACGVILLFAGPRVCRRAWFPLALLLCVQPVPAAVVSLFDLPLQSFSAHIARSFASLIGFPPTSRELLKLMFTPDFGMFIAPGCDGMRGAVTLGYSALIVGYLKRVSIARWFLYVSSAVLLGHLFNLIRLCTLVLYYRIAVGHPTLESMAKQADYAIGGFLFLVAVVLFLWVVFRKEGNPTLMRDLSATRNSTSDRKQRLIYLRVVAFAFLVLLVVVPGLRAIPSSEESLAASIRNGRVTPKELDDRMPKQLGGYRLVRTWQEQSGGVTSIEDAAYRTDVSNEINLGIWLRPSEHRVQASWAAQDKSPKMIATSTFVTAQGKPVSFDINFYSDGVTDSLTGDVDCTPSSCRTSPEYEDGVHFGLMKTIDFSTRGVRAVPIFFVVQAPHMDAPDTAIQSGMLAECQAFLYNVDLNEISTRFQ